MSKVSKNIFIIAFAALTAVFLALAFSACSKKDNASDSKWNRSGNIALAFVREADCPDGNVNEERLSAEMNCKLNEDYLMVIDTTIQAAADNDGRSTVELVVNIKPFEVLSAKVKDADSSKVEEKTTENGTNIKAGFSIPDKKSNVKNVRLVIELRATMEGQAEIDVSLQNGSSQSVQLAKTGELNKRVNVGYTEGLTYRVSDGNYVVTGVMPKTLTKIVIPSETAGYNVVAIDENAFKNCTSLKEITIPQGITSIGESAFIGCRSLESITVPDSVTDISASAFSGCAGLKQVILPANLKTIGSNAFYGCTGLGSITVPESVKSIGSDAFRNCTALASVNIKDIAAWCKINFESEMANPAYYAQKLALNGNELTGLFVPSSVKSIGQYAFVNCGGLTTVVISENVTVIGDCAFKGCGSVKTVVIGNKVKTIGKSAFSGCKSLELAVMDNSITSIGDRAFLNCVNLKAVIIGKSLVKIGESAFSGCTNLSELIFKGNTAKWERVSKGNDWRLNAGIKAIHCSDGDITITG